MTTRTILAAGADAVDLSVTVNALDALRPTQRMHPSATDVFRCVTDSPEGGLSDLKPNRKSFSRNANARGPISGRNSQISELGGPVTTNNSKEGECSASSRLNQEARRNSAWSIAALRPNKDKVRQRLARAPHGELMAWAKSLETKVAEQARQLERLSRLKRFLSPQLVDMILDDRAH